MAADPEVNKAEGSGSSPRNPKNRRRCRSGTADHRLFLQFGTFCPFDAPGPAEPAALVKGGGSGFGLREGDSLHLPDAASVVCNPERHFLCRTMITSKNKNRAVLPRRPEPPSMEQVLEEIRGAAADDPVFSVLEQKSPGEDEEPGSSRWWSRAPPSPQSSRLVLIFSALLQNRSHLLTARWSCASSSVGGI